jgi:hypothetical protein
MSAKPMTSTKDLARPARVQDCHREHLTAVREGDVRDTHLTCPLDRCAP